MRMTFVVVLAFAIAGAALAQTNAPTTGPVDIKPSCKAQASDKKLAGAAFNSFMKKCQTDAEKACDAAAAEKKLNGAAKTSFTKKCVTDAVGST
jgi:hypothetical protein